MCIQRDSGCNSYTFWAPFHGAVRNLYTIAIVAVYAVVYYIYTCIADRGKRYAAFELAANSQI